jgi:curved DNA-binding protein CbpA
VLKNYYAILGVSNTADQEAIHQAFRRQARRYHPDAGPGASSERFREAVEAYETLSNPLRRGRYDQILQPASIQPEPLIPNRETKRSAAQSRPVSGAASSDPFAIADELFAAFETYFDALLGWH